MDFVHVAIGQLRIVFDERVRIEPPECVLVDEFWSAVEPHLASMASGPVKSPPASPPAEPQPPAEESPSASPPAEPQPQAEQAEAESTSSDGPDDKADFGGSRSPSRARAMPAKAEDEKVSDQDMADAEEAEEAKPAEEAMPLLAQSSKAGASAARRAVSDHGRQKRFRRSAGSADLKADDSADAGRGRQRQAEAGRGRQRQAGRQLPTHASTPSLIHTMRGSDGRL